jgi:hypothetical protein
MLRLLLLDAHLIRGWMVGMSRTRGGTVIPIILSVFLLAMLSIGATVFMRLTWHRRRVVQGIPDWLARPIHLYIRGKHVWNQN